MDFHKIMDVLSTTQELAFIRTLDKSHVVYEVFRDINCIRSITTDCSKKSEYQVEINKWFYLCGRL